MNHLAHAFLARENHHWVVGSLIADVRPRPLNLPPEISEGMALHQRIDGFADQNEHFRAIRASLRPAAGLYAGVAADICCDNLLIAHWQRYSGQPLEQFTEHVYKTLHSANGHLPPSLKSSSARPKVDWLAGYQYRSGLEQAFLRVRAKVKSGRRFPDVDRVLDLFFAEQKQLAPHFTRFFDQLVDALPGIQQTL